MEIVNYITTNVLRFLQGTMPTPTMFGLVHLLTIGLIVLTSIILCLKFGNVSYKTFKTILLVFWIGMIILEIYKQIVFSFYVEGAHTTFNYQWEVLPYQFSSVIMYILPIALFTKGGKLHISALAFVSTFSLLIGILTISYPVGVFSTTIGINIQSMYLHGTQVVLGIYILVYNRDKLNIRYFVSACIVFTIAVLVALGINIIVPNFTSETCNIFFISPYYDCPIPVLCNIYTYLKTMGLYPLFVVIYISISSLGALLIYSIAILINRLVKHHIDKNSQTTEISYENINKS